MFLDSRVITARYGPEVLRLIPGATPFTQDLDAFNEWLKWVVKPKNASKKNPEPDPEVWRPLRPQRYRRKR